MDYAVIFRGAQNKTLNDETNYFYGTNNKKYFPKNELPVENLKFHKLEKNEYIFHPNIKVCAFTDLVLRTGDLDKPFSVEFKSGDLLIDEIRGDQIKKSKKDGDYDLLFSFTTGMNAFPLDNVKLIVKFKEDKDDKDDKEDKEVYIGYRLVWYNKDNVILDHPNYMLPFIKHEYGVINLDKDNTSFFGLTGVAELLTITNNNYSKITCSIPNIFEKIWTKDDIFDPIVIVDNKVQLDIGGLTNYILITLEGSNTDKIEYCYEYNCVIRQEEEEPEQEQEQEQDVPGQGPKTKLILTF